MTRRRTRPAAPPRPPVEVRLAKQPHAIQVLHVHREPIALHVEEAPPLATAGSR